MQDGNPGLVVGLRDVEHQPPGEPRQQPVIERFDLGRRAIAGQHHLLLAGEHHVEHPQELRLHFPLAAEELDVVHQQQVGITEPGAEPVAVAGGQRHVKALDELVQREELDAGSRVHREDLRARWRRAGGSCPCPGAHR